MILDDNGRNFAILCGAALRVVLENFLEHKLNHVRSHAGNNRANGHSKLVLSPGFASYRSLSESRYHCAVELILGRVGLLQHTARSLIATAIAGVLLVACNHSRPSSDFVVVRADRQITGHSQFPVAVDPNRVGTYPPDTKSGAGYFYDDVLEYRVWLHPEKGAEPLNGTNDYFVAFAQYEPAATFSQKATGAEPPLVLVRQLEWIDEPETGHFVPEKGDRVTEWQVVWLAESKRTDRSIEEFLKHPKEAGPDQNRVK